MKRTQRAEIAQQTVNIVKQGFYLTPTGIRRAIAAQVKRSLQGTKLFRPDDFNSLEIKGGQDQEPHFDVQNETSLAAATRLVVDRQRKGVLCLNFASAKNPGGGYLGGSQAQEESLARSSALVKTLESKWDYYEVNRNCKSAFYTDHMILSPDVPVFRDDNGHLLEEPYLLSFLTAPAVNAGAVEKNEPSRVHEIDGVMLSRTDKVLSIAASQGYQHLVLGAWGCGVFRNDPRTVARLFAEALLGEGRFRGHFASITFAVLDHTEKQKIIEPFQNQFKESITQS